MSSDYYNYDADYVGYMETQISFKKVYHLEYGVPGMFFAADIYIVVNENDQSKFLLDKPIFKPTKQKNPETKEFKIPKVFLENIESTSIIR